MGRMRQILCLAAACLLLFVWMSGCAAPSGAATAHTVLVYMVGSDLETEAGLASGDMAEMLAGAGAGGVNLLVLAGGAAEWQKDEGAGGAGLYKNEADKWVLLEQRPDWNMGEASTLAEFLRYGKENFPADRLGLVLWNHGAGPLEGFGGDQLYGQDPLTLDEMRRALADSPFSGRSKLEWVGFDACLMSSLETAHVFSGHTKYLIASQEAEPGDGWDYGFLAQLPSAGTGADVGRLAIDAYIDYYTNQYAGYTDYIPKLTLACLELGKLDKTITALDALAENLQKTLLQQHYSKVAQNRRNARDFGRFTLGMDYDLADLNDLAGQYLDTYTASATALQKALEGLVVYQAGNVERAGGVSIYAPCYNKRLYEEKWGESYGGLEVSSGYSDFVRSYTDIWLGEDLLDPDEEEPLRLEWDKKTDVFSVQLSAPQRENLAEAKFYVLNRAGGEQYQSTFSSNDVSMDDDGRLHYAYDRRALFCVDAATGELGGTVRFFERDRTEERVEYLVFGALDIWGPGGTSLSQGGSHVPVYFQLALPNGSDEAQILGIVETDSSDAQAASKKQYTQQDADMVDLLNSNYYLTRDEYGRPLPFDEWVKSGVLQGYEFYTKKDGYAGVAFKMLDIEESSQDIACMMVMEDTQGNKYASNLLTIYNAPARTDTDIEQAFEEAKIEQVDHKIDLSQETTTLLYENSDISVSLLSAETEPDHGKASLRFLVENHTNADIDFSGDYLYLNGFAVGYYLQKPDAEFFSLDFDSSVPARGSAEFEWSGYYKDLDGIDEGVVRTLDMGFEYQDPAGDTDAVKTDMVCIETQWRLEGFSPPGDTEAITRYDEILLDNDACRITLLTARMNHSLDQWECELEVENKTDYPLKFGSEYVSADGWMLDSVYLGSPEGYSSSLMPHKKYLSTIRIEKNQLQAYGLEAPEELEFRLTIRAGEMRELYRPAETVSLQLSSPQDAQPGEAQTILDRDGLTVSVYQAPVLNPGTDRMNFTVEIENDSDAYIELLVRDATINGKGSTSLYVYGGGIAPGKKAVSRVTVSADELQKLGITTVNSVHFTLLVVDTQQNKLIRATEEYAWSSA